MSTTQPIKSIEKLHEFEDYYLNVKPNPRNHTLIIMGLNSALRISDILSLKYGDIYDFNQNKWKTHITITEQKTKKVNCIYINRKIQAELDLYADCSIHTETDWLFTSQMYKDRPLSRYQAFRLVKEAAAYAGFDCNISCHSLRKTFGYHAWKQGTPPAMLMNIYNHSCFQVTKRYLGIDQDDKDAVFQQIVL